MGRQSAMKTIRIGSTRLQIKPGYVVTTLHDGAQVEAVPHDTVAYAETAERLGYGDDVAAMSRDHELVHVWLAQALGLPESPVMRAVATGAWQHGPVSLVLEEAAVCAVQAIARAWGVDVMATCGATKE